MIHRIAKQTPGQTALVTGANGGVGQALLQLLPLAGVRAFGAANARHHDLVRSLGGTPVESRDGPIDRRLRELVPGGVDAAYDALGARFVAQCRRSVRRGGIVVAYGFSSAAAGPDRGPANLSLAAGFFDLFVRTPLAGRRASFYGITALYRKNSTPFREDLPVLFDLLKRGQITPTITARLPLLDARHANELLEAGGVNGKIVLVRDVG
jgi:NADPH:quinone reductase-like Zn-dependent oxidoreductase